MNKMKLIKSYYDINAPTELPESTGDVNTLPIDSAPLPRSYLAAKNALAECTRIDECKDWANKAAALASYNKQSKDMELYNYALRIQAIATRRCGELLAQIESAQGANQYDELRGDAPPKLGRGRAAREAGLSVDQAKAALRVASVPEEQFTEQVESDNPPTITKLAEQGTKKKPKPIVDIGDIDPEDYKVATQTTGHLVNFLESVSDIDLRAALRGLDQDERNFTLQKAVSIATWINSLINLLRV